ncbi:MAG: response regulator [Chloroflexota bacterium]
MSDHPETESSAVPDELLIELCPLNEICRASLQAIYDSASQKKQRVSYSISPNDMLVSVDRRRLTRALVYLLGNAVKFSPKKTQIGLDVLGSDDSDSNRRRNFPINRVEITVWDSGEAITGADLERLFHSLERQSASGERLAGSGSGMAEVQNLVELHGGSLHVQSAPGQGNRFTITLPALEPRFTSDSPVKPVQPPALECREALARLAIVDDYPGNVQPLADMLRLNQYEVLTYTNGIEFLEQVAGDIPDLVLMDIQMPGIDGLETTRRLRALPDPRLAAVPVIAVTALVMEGNQERCMQAGASAYLARPFSLQRLVAVIEKILCP